MRSRFAGTKTAALATATLLTVVPVATPATDAGAQERQGVVAGALALRQLDGVKRVLMIAAHPDDEDTGLLAALARGMGAETAYLSLTRGEGGQNLIGDELHEGLGIVRTGELLAARGLDGGEQFFTRAFDFGYSKNLAETLEHWPLEEVVRDAVFVVRTFRPQVIVSVFSGTPRDGHGQHQAAGAVAREAFRAAGDPTRFPELSRYGASPWQPTKLYRSARFAPLEATVRVATGDFDPVLGRSHHQLAMESRSQHRSQDMGADQWPGPRTTGIQLLETAADADVEYAAEDGIFSGVDTTLVGQLPDPLDLDWPLDARARLARYRRAVHAASTGPWIGDSRNALAQLSLAAATLQRLVADAPPGRGRDALARRLEQARDALLAFAGVVIDVRLSRDALAPGEEVLADVLVWNGGSTDLENVDPELILPNGWSASRTERSASAPRSRFFRMPPPPTPADARVPAGELARWSWRIRLPADARFTIPYYLEEERRGALYAWPDDPGKWARGLDPSPVRARVRLALRRLAASDDGHWENRTRPDAHRPLPLAVEREGTYVGVDKAMGEYRKRVLALPAIDVSADPRSMVWPQALEATREVSVSLTNLSASPRSGTVRLEAPEGWRVEPAAAPYSLAGTPDGSARSSGASGTFTFRLGSDGDGGVQEGTHVFRVVARQGAGTEATPGASLQRGREFVHDVRIVDYPHIPRAALIDEAVLRVRVFPVAIDPELRVGYVMGSGDGGARALRQLGARVDELGPAQLRAGDFGAYDALVLGVRAYETRADLIHANDAVLDFARRGGTVIVQYNKYEFPAGDFAPYPVAMRRPHDRVTDETAAVTALAPESPVFSGPNTLSERDFQGWVQERGLYFLSEWDPRYRPVMEMADPGEEPKRGGLLVAPVGEGLYVYCALALFRQFPAGVPGAHRLLANLVSMRAEDWRRSMGPPRIGDRSGTSQSPQPPAHLNERRAGAAR